MKDLKGIFTGFQDVVLSFGGRFADKDLCRVFMEPHGSNWHFTAEAKSSNNGGCYQVEVYTCGDTKIEDLAYVLTLPQNRSEKFSLHDAREAYRSYEEETLANSVSELLNDGRVPGVDKAGYYYLENYSPDEWRLNKEELSDIFDDAKEMSYMGAFREVLRELADEDARSYRDISNEYIVPEIMKLLSKHDKKTAEYFPETLEQAIDSWIIFDYHEEDWNSAMKVNLLMDSGNWDFECNCDDLLSSSQPKERLAASSIAYTAELAGKKKELLSALAGAESEKEDLFIGSIFEELENNPYPNGSTMTFLVSLPLLDVLRILDAKEAIKHGEKDDRLPSSIKIPSNTMCGLFNPWNGSGSLLEVKLPCDLTIPVDKVELQLEDYPFYGYSVDQAYGLVGSAWKEAEV